MTLEDQDLQLLTRCACAAARAAGHFIATARPSNIQHKAGLTGASQVVTNVDREAEERILQELAPTIERFDLGVLSEERADDRSRLDKEFFWCIDPLDGTLPFIEGVPGYAVSIALVSHSGRPEIGAVFDPVHQTLYSATRGLGMRRNGRPWQRVANARGETLSVFCDRSLLARPDYADILAGLQEIARDMGLRSAEVYSDAGAVMNACQALDNAPACYFKFPKPGIGGGSLWDFAATACFFREAGAIASDIHGAPLALNRVESTYMNHSGVVYATSAELAERVRGLYLP